MNPRGQVQDWNALKQAGLYSEQSQPSPEICHDIVKGTPLLIYTLYIHYTTLCHTLLADLHSPSGKGNNNIFLISLKLHFL